MNVTRVWRSTIGRKFIMAISGLVLILFLIVHLAGNLMMFVPDGGATFNSYSHKLNSMKPWLYIAEIGLLAVFLFHIGSGLRVFIENMRARRSRYAVHASKGRPSKLSTASRSMILTGFVLLLFVPLHVMLFKYGAHYETIVNGEPMRDLYRLVVEKFKQPGIALAYSGVMFLLGAHLRHGFWSALQSLGAMSARLSPLVYTVGLLFAVLLAGGFFVMPLYILAFAPLP